MCVEYFKEIVQRMNKEKLEYIESVHNDIVYSTIGHAKYHFLDEHGPKYGKVTKLHSVAVR